VQRVSDQVLAGPYDLGKASQVVPTVAMAPDTSSDRTQAMSDVVLLIVEEELLADRFFKQAVSTCSW
jgi:hypothetical protein